VWGRIVRLPPVLFFAALAAGSVANILLPLPIGLASFAWNLGAGALLVLTALAIAGEGLFELRKRRTPVEPWQTPAALVTSGVFAINRNPLYLALVLTLFGFGVMFDTWWLMVFAATLWIALDRVVIREEERLVEAAFPEEYAAYRRQVGRWLPRVTRRWRDSR
jgi:protein-S-isoprenylcysteine O-methyltransferase Ste14